MEVGLPEISNSVGPVKYFLSRLLSFHLKEFFSFVFFRVHSSRHRRPKLARNHSVGFSPTHTSLRSILRPRLLMQTPFSGSGMPIQVHDVLPHTISGTELSRVRTELYQLRIFPSSSPHPVQAKLPACVPWLLSQCSS